MSSNLLEQKLCRSCGFINPVGCKLADRTDILQSLSELTNTPIGKIICLFKTSLLEGDHSLVYKMLLNFIVPKVNFNESLYTNQFRQKIFYVL